MGERRQTARRNRSTSSASPTRGENRGRVRTWRGKQRPKAALPARWPRSRTGAGPIGTGLSASSASGCLQCSMVIMLTTASRGIFGGYRIIATRSRGYGTSGWSGEREEGGSHGLAFMRFSPVASLAAPAEPLELRRPIAVCRSIFKLLQKRAGFDNCWAAERVDLLIILIDQRVERSRGSFVLQKGSLKKRKVGEFWLW
jgi:hypothetical protein